MNQKSIRIDAIDVFRGLTMFFMLWVNSFWSLSEVPHWLRHAASGEDMLGFSDIIFPAFLFIMGSSVPMALENRLAKGDSVWKIVGHILTRSIALIAMGLLTVNFGDAYGAAQTGLSRGNYAILMVVGCFLVWNTYPRKSAVVNVLYRIMQVAGVALLIYLAVIFRGKDDSTFAIRWWGILGRIGWTYLFCSLVFLVVRKKMIWNLIIVGALIVGALLQAERIITGDILPNSLTIFAFGSTGVVLSLLLDRYANKIDPKRFYIYMGLIGSGMFLAGLGAHQFWIVSKLSATPTWYFYCCAIFFPVFGLLYYITDVKGKTKWFNWVKPAGTAALSCYVVAYAWNPLVSIIFSNPILRPEFSIGILGLLNSFCYSLILIWSVWLLMKINIRLKV